MTKLIQTFTLAASKAVDTASVKAARADVSVGKHFVDFMVRVTGFLTVGEDYEQRLVAKADPFALLAVALSKLNGVTLEALVREALEAAPEEIKEIKARAAEAVQALKAPTMTVCNGKVTTDLKFEIVEVK